MTRTSLLLTALLVVAAATAGLSGAVASNAEEVSSAETASQLQDDDLADAAVDSGDVFWQGQFLEFSADEDNATEVWAVREVQDGEVGSLVTEVMLDSNGSAVVGTAGLDGQYVVVDGDEQPVVFENGQAQQAASAGEASFEVATQTLDVSFGADTVRNDDHPEARTDLEIESNRASYGASLFSENLSADELADVFAEAEADDDRAVVTRNLSDDDVLDANFTGVDPGTYNVTVAAADGAAEDTATITVTEPIEGEAGLSNDTFVENRGDMVRFNVTFDGTDEATVDLGSADVGYHAQFTVVDGDEDGEATVEFDTFRAGQSAGTPGVSATGEDNVTNASLETDPLSGPLDAAGYPVEVSVGTQRTAVGLVELTERSIGEMEVWTAPSAASVDSVSELTEVATQDTEVARQDWAIVRVEASGLYAYVENVSDLNDNETGLSTTLIRAGERNVPPEDVGLDQVELLADDEGDQFFLVVNTNALDENATYETNFTVTAANPYVESGNATTLTTNFTLVDRNVTFDEPIEVPASSDATVSGSSSVAAGTELSVEVSNTEDEPFLERTTAEVGEDGTWEATVDLSDVSPGTNFTVDVADPQANASGVVVEGDGGAEAAGDDEAAGNETEAADDETTAENETETTVEDDAIETTAADEAGEDETGEDEAATETAAADEDGAAADEDEANATDEDGADAGEEDDAGAGDGDGAADDGAADDEDGAVGEDDGTTAADAGADAGDDTTTAEATPEEDDGAAAGEDEGDAAAAEEDETTTTDDEAEAASAPAPGFGPVGVLTALVVLVAVGMLAVRRY